MTCDTCIHQLELSELLLLEVCSVVHDHLPLVSVNLVTEHDERKVVRIGRRGLDQEFVLPVIERFECDLAVHIEHEHTTIGT